MLELIEPSTAKIEIHGAHAVAESLRFLSWFVYESVLTDCLSAILTLQVSEAIRLIGKANNHAAGLPASVNANEGLAAFCVLAKLNKLRYIDPALTSHQPEEEMGARDLDNEAIVEIVSTLALRFSMAEIKEMTPEFALLCWQRIREEIAHSRNVIFYSTELGYRRRNIGKEKYKLVPRKSPYTPFWVKSREEMDRPTPIVPRLVSHPDKIIDGMSGKSLVEIGEVTLTNKGEM